MTSNKTFNLNLNVGDQLTSISCGHVIVELIKLIAYQRLQIPYNYQWLKQIVTNKLNRDDHAQKDSLQSQRHFKIASLAIKNLDFINKSLLQEISGPLMPEEICIVLGPTPVTCKEVYRLLLPTLCHKPQCHSDKIAKDHKIQSNIFRKLVTSEELNQALNSNLPPTNMHVFIKKKVISNQDSMLNHDIFVPASGYRIPKSSKVITIDFRTIDALPCCDQFEIFGESGVLSDCERATVNNLNEIQSTDTLKWYQSTYVMKGFKDCVVNGNSVINSWL